MEVDNGDHPYVSEGEIVAGKYRVDRILGVGGVGFVVAARHTELGGDFALKFLKERFLKDKAIVERFTREARAACRIKSEYVARVYDVGAHGNAPFMVMEHLTGRDLAAVLEQRGAFPIAEAVEYAVQACAALASAHANGIVHRDIKPENLFLIDEEGLPTVKLLDFGISKVALVPDRSTDDWGSEGEPITGTLTCGTPFYMSPEQIRSTANVDARTDVWSLGMVLYELLAGTTAFRGDNVTDVCKAILDDEPRWLTDVRPEVPLGLAEVVARCLQKDVSLRFRDVGELAVALLPYAPPRALAIAEGSAGIRRAAIQALGSGPSSDGRLSGGYLVAGFETGPTRTGPPSGRVSLATPTPALPIAPRVATRGPATTQSSPRPLVKLSRRGMNIALGASGGAILLGSILAWTITPTRGAPGADAVGSAYAPLPAAPAAVTAPPIPPSSRPIFVDDLPQAPPQERAPAAVLPANASGSFHGPAARARATTTTRALPSPPASGPSKTAAPESPAAPSAVTPPVARTRPDVGY